MGYFKPTNPEPKIIKSQQELLDYIKIKNEVKYLDLLEIVQSINDLNEWIDFLAFAGKVLMWCDSDGNPKTLTYCYDTELDFMDGVK